MSRPVVSIIISVFGELDYTRKCFSLVEETLDGKLEYEVIVIDDKSKDGTIEFLKNLVLVLMMDLSQQS